jgi:hypothetical protein
MFNIAFNTDLPVAAASPFTASGRVFAAGDAVDWRALGVSELVLFDWWRANLVVFKPEVAGEEPQAEVGQPKQRQRRSKE